jgi:polygalacturonase
MTPITEGMTPAQFNTAMNNNIASVGFTGQVVSFTTSMLGHELKTAFTLNNIGILNFGKHSSFITDLNNTLSSISIADKIIAGAADVKTFGAVGDGSHDDAADINTAVAAGNIIIQNGTFKISASIKIPSNRTVYLFNCKLKMANSSFDNFFRNSDMDGGNSNIYIIGLGGAELDGNCTNNSDGYATYGINPPAGPITGTAYRYIGIIFCNVDGFEIRNLYLSFIPHWSFYLQKTRNGSVHDIFIEKDTEIVNQDGIDLGHGCHDVDIYNMAIECADDFSAIAVANYSGFAYTGFVGWNVGDCYNISYYDIDIYDMKAGAILAPLIGDGGKIYNVSIENVRIRKGGSIFYGSYLGYNDVACVKTDFHDITIDNVRFDTIQTRTNVFYFGQSMMDFAATNIVNNTGATLYTLTAGDQSDNVKINEVQVT